MILFWRNVYSCFILPTSQMLSYTSMMGLINRTTTVRVGHDFAFISILLFDFILPFLVVSEENLPTTWRRISPMFKMKKRSLLVSQEETEMRFQLTACISYPYFQKIMSGMKRKLKVIDIIFCFFEHGISLRCCTRYPYISLLTWKACKAYRISEVE